MLKLSHLLRTRFGRYIGKISLIILVSILLIFFVFRTASSVEHKIVDDDKTLVHLENNVKQSKPFYSINHSEISRMASLYFPPYAVVYTNGIAYDIYSIRELGQQGVASQWLTFPLPNEINNVEPWMPKSYSNKTFPFFQSPPTKSGLAYIDQIYVLSDPSLYDRIQNIQRMFVRHDIPIDSIDWWRMGKWNRTTCNAQANQAEVWRILNLEPGLIGGDTEQRYCAVTVQHVELWREIAAMNSTIALILEDDAIFVPFFKEKFNRFIYTAVRTGTLKIGSHQCATPRANISANEWLNQDPAFVVGTCSGLHDETYLADKHDAPPRITTHKERFSRCSHAYILTSCSAKAMIKLIDSNKMRFQILDWLQTYLAEKSLTLQPFWLDPPLVHQGSQARDLDGILTFGRSTP